MQQYVLALPRELKLAVRSLGSSLGATALVVSVMAVGMGGLATSLAIVDGIWIQAVPYRNADRLVVISGRTPRKPIAPLRWQELMAWRTHLRDALLDVAAYGQSRNVSVRVNGQERSEATRLVEPQFFEVLGERPIVGRLFGSNDRTRASLIPVVVTETLWRARLGSRTDVGAIPVDINGERCVVIGVVSDHIRAIQTSSVFMPLYPPETGRDIWNLTLLGRLRRGMSVTTVQRALDGVPGDILIEGQSLPRATITPLREAVLGRDVDRMLLIILGVAALVLFIICADVILVVLGGIERKRHEIRLKLSIGASPGWIIHEFLVEGFLYAGLSGIIGLGLITWTLGSVTTLIPHSIPRTSEIQLTTFAVIGTVIVSLIVGIGATLIPATWIVRQETSNNLATPAHVSFRTYGPRLLIGTQSTLTVIAVSLAAVLLRSFTALSHVPLGFDPTNTIRVDVLSTDGTYLHGAAALDLEQQTITRLRQQAGVVAVGATDQPPLGGITTLYGIRTSDGDSDEVQCYYRRVTPGYLEAIGIHLIRGRDFTKDDIQGSPNVVLVNETAAKVLWRGADPLGHLVYATREQPFRVIGVVADVRSEGLDQAPVPEIYRSRLQEPLGGAIFVVRTSDSPVTVLARLTQPHSDILPPGLKLKGANATQEAIDRSISSPRFRAVVVAAMAALGLILSITGIAGLTSRAVVARAREMGTRLALGASGKQCIRLIVAQSLSPVAIGAFVGIACTLWATRLLRGLVFQISESDPSAIAAATLITIATAAAAAFVPARAAAGIDPSNLLRKDWG